MSNLQKADIIIEKRSKFWRFFILNMSMFLKIAHTAYNTQDDISEKTAHTKKAGGGPAFCDAYFAIFARSSCSISINQSFSRTLSNSESLMNFRVISLSVFVDFLNMDLLFSYPFSRVEV